MNDRPPNDNDVIIALRTILRAVNTRDIATMERGGVSAMQHLDALAEDLTGTSDFCERQDDIG